MKNKFNNITPTLIIKFNNTKSTLIIKEFLLIISNPFLLYSPLIITLYSFINHQYSFHLFTIYPFKNHTNTLPNKIITNEHFNHSTLTITKYYLQLFKTFNLSSSKPSNISKNTSKLSPFNQNKKLTLLSKKLSLKYSPNLTINTLFNHCLKNFVSTSKPKSTM